MLYRLLMCASGASDARSASQMQTESASGEAWTTIRLTVCLPPREIVPHCARRWVQHNARVERGRVAQRLVREVRGPVHHVCGGEERRERREDLGVAPVIQGRGFAQEEAARAKAQMGAMSRVGCEEVRRVRRVRWVHIGERTERGGR